MSAPTPSPRRANMPSAAACSTCSRAAIAQALRLDFFGDEIETLRRFDPADPAHHRHGSTGFTLLPRQRGAARRGQRQALPRALSRGVRRGRRPATRCTRRSATAGGSPAWSTGCRCSRTGWRRCSTISATDAVVVRDAGADEAADERGSRRSPIITTTAARRSAPRSRQLSPARRPTRSI